MAVAYRTIIHIIMISGLCCKYLVFGSGFKMMGSLAVMLGS